MIFLNQSRAERSIGASPWCLHIYSVRPRECIVRCPRDWPTEALMKRGFDRTTPFADRREAGRVLAEALKDYAGRDVLVLGIPRGGVPVADEVARRLGADLDVLVARKLGAPDQPELAIGAVTANGGEFINEE